MGNARYIPQRRPSVRRWRDRFPNRRLALAMAAMVLVALVLFRLFSDCSAIDLSAQRVPHLSQYGECRVAILAVSEMVFPSRRLTQSPWPNISHRVATSESQT